MKTLPPLVALCALALAGCAKDGGDDVVESTPPPVAENVAFEGELDPSLAATWQTDDGKSTLVLGSDGAAKIKSRVPTPGGMAISDDAGQWKAHDGALLIRKADGATTRFFLTKKDSKTLELRRMKDSKIKIVYRRKA